VSGLSFSCSGPTALASAIALAMAAGSGEPLLSSAIASPVNHGAINPNTTPAINAFNVKRMSCSLQ